MRADRLLAILLILERGGRITAADLAQRLEVSERTVYRDLEALGAAGVPVFCQPGPGGGIQLVEGYTTDLSGLSLGEAEFVPLLGLSDVFSGLGLGPSLKQTEAKVLMSLPDDQRHRAEQARRRIYVDVSRWWDTAEAVPHLPTVAEAVFAGRKLRIQYRRGEDAQMVRRTVDALGLVVQGGTWYLVARVRRRDTRIYRVSRIESAQIAGAHDGAPADFDLPAFWARRKEEFHETRSMYPVVVRLRPGALRALARSHDIDRGVEPNAEWTRVELSFVTRWAAFERLLSLGPGVIVVEPAELRAGIERAVRETAALYA